MSREIGAIGRRAGEIAESAGGSGCSAAVLRAELAILD
jgi:hypothetical protein